MTSAQIALNELVQTLEALQRLYVKPVHARRPDHQSRLEILEARQTALERQLAAEVKNHLGIDYATLWFAVTPTD